MPSEVIAISYKSEVLRNNPLKDPYKRDIIYYLPPSYGKSDTKYPVVYLISGYTGYGMMNMNVNAYSENIQERLDRLIKTKQIKEMIVVMPDCMTLYGGNQYINSKGTGNYEDYLLKEIIPCTDENFRTIPKANSRCIIGKSSGGYGAMWLAMHHPDVFGLMATHSGDCAFEYCYLPDFPKTVIALENYGKGDKAVHNFIKTELGNKKRKPKAFFDILLTIGMAAHYSPNPKKKEYNFDLPFDLNTLEIIPEIWNKWLKYDPVRLVDKYKNNLKKLKMIFIDCGIRDQFNLYAGARIFADKLKKNGIKYIHQEFDDTHMNIQYRYDVSFKYISENFSYR
ncbi:MAG: esterase [Ignavibacteriae bacterium]|nr:MAG: esterase [Ignavibacteriota bacterium]